MNNKERMGVLGASVLGASVALSGSGVSAEAGYDADFENATANTEQMETDSAQVLRDFVENKGFERLTFEEARDLVPHISNLFTSSISNTALDAEGMVDKTFVMPGGFTDEDLKYMNSDLPADQSPLFQRISGAYPDIEYGSEINSSTINAVYDGLGGNIRTNKGIEGFAGWLGYDFNMPDSTMGVTVDWDDVTLIPLEATNENIHLQIDDISDSQCAKASPAVAFITTQVHEYGHLDTLANTHGYDKELKSAVISEAGKYLSKDNKKYQEGGKSGFRINLQRENKSGDLVAADHFIGLDEFVTHFIAVKILEENDIPSMILAGARDAKGLRHFEAIMEQSGISLNELARLHRDGRLERFLVKVADGAKNKEFNSENQKIKYAFRKFIPLFKNESDWYRTFEEDFDIEGSKRPEVPADGSDSLYFNGCYVNFDSK